MEQFQNRKREARMTGTESLYDLGLTPEQQKILQEEQLYLQKHEQEKTAIQQEADQHNISLEKKRRGGSIAFDQKYQNAVSEAWRKHKNDLFSLEQEYQAKMKGMYDSEGKILKDKDKNSKKKDK